MDPHASVLYVTEDFATRGSSGFSKELWPGMDTTTLLFALKQGMRSLEDHTQYFLAIVDYSDLPDIVLMEVFYDGINQPLRSRLRREGPRSSLGQFLDYALLTVGSLFTVGVAEEELDTVSITEMVAAPEGDHKMVATTTLSHVTVDLSESSKDTADRPESRHVTADHPESLYVSADLPESGHGIPNLQESNQVIADLHKLSQTFIDLHDSNQFITELHESSHC